MTKRLYIIGNGFDLHHKIKSSYSDFRNFVYDKHHELFKILEEYFEPKDLWSDFEKTLAFLDTEKIIDRANNFLNSYGHPEWKESMHHDYQYEIQSKIDLLTKDLKTRFTEWVYQMDIPEEFQEQLKLKTDSKFLSFNYTSTLEKLYGVKESNIIHIHNKIIDLSSNLILGHSREPTTDNSFNKDSNEEDDTRIIEGNAILDDYFSFTYKTTKKIINDNSDYFNALNDIEEIFILGHALTDIDKPYFEKIIQVINKNKVIWRISYHLDSDLKKHLEFMVSLGIKEENISIEKITQFNDPNDNQIKMEIF